MSRFGTHIGSVRVGITSPWSEDMRRFVYIAIISLGLGVAVGCSNVSFKAKKKGGDGDDNTPQCTENCVTPPTGTTHTETFSLPPAANKIDILFVVDNSASMTEEQNKMATRFSSFISSISGMGLNYRIGIITTDMTGFGPTQDGNLLKIAGTSNDYIINPSDGSTSTLSNRFKNTVKRNEVMWPGDERGIYAAISAIAKNQSGWIRGNADLAIVILSDEDERSAGGDEPGYPMECGEAFDSGNMKGRDCTEDLVRTVKSNFPNKTFTVHSLIVKPGDSNCLDNQVAQGGPSNAHYGTEYKKLSDRTGGEVGSICANDYGSQLSDIADVIIDSRDSWTLKCVPQNGDVQILQWPTGFPQNPPPYTSGDKLIFPNPLQSGDSITVRYTCS